MRKDDSAYFVCFTMGKKHYALPMENVEQVLRMADLLQVPEQPVWIAGILNFHGKGLPVLDMRRRLGVSHKPIDKGTGLGFSVSHSIIDDHGGKIACESKVAEGTTMTVILPMDSVENNQSYHEEMST